MDETEEHSYVVLPGDKAVFIPMNGTENSDELNDLVHSALLTITQSVELTQNMIHNYCRSEHYVCHTYGKLSVINYDIEFTIECNIHHA